MHRRDRQTGLHDFFEFGGAVGEVAAAAAQRARRADDHREIEPLLDPLGVLHAARIAAARQVQADAAHGFFEQIAVFGFFDRLQFGADHLDAVLFQDALLGQIDGEIERRLAAEGRQDRVGPLLGDDFLDDVGGDRLDIGAVGETGIGHDRRRIGVDQDDPVALFLERLQRLGAGVIELAGLADDDRPGADE